MPFSDATIISGHHCPLICVLSPYVYTFIAVTTIYNSMFPLLGFPVAQAVKNLPEMQETPVQSLGREDLLEKGMATLSSIFPWRAPWTEEPGGLQSMGSQRVGHN